MESMFIAYGTTALEILRLDRETPGGIILPHENSSDEYRPDAPSSALWREAEASLASLGCSRPYHILVGNQRDRRRKSETLQTHLMEKPPTGTVFPRITRDLYVSPPELCLLQLACRLNDIQLLGIAYEMCGCYTRAECGKPSPKKLTPVTDPEAIRSFLACAKGFHGAKPLARVSKHILGGSRSVKETQMTLEVSLPDHLHGFALPAPHLNYQIGVPFAERAMLGTACYTVDLCWPEHRLVVEYDSEAFHGESRREADSKRRNGLRYLGYTVIEANASNLATTFDAARLARNLARLMGLDAKPGQFDVTAEKIRAHSCIMGLSKWP